LQIKYYLFIILILITTVSNGYSHDDIFDYISIENKKEIMQVWQKLDSSAKKNFIVHLKKKQKKGRSPASIQVKAESYHEKSAEKMLGILQSPFRK